MTGPTWETPGQAVRLFLRGATLGAAWKIAVVVGTLLSVVNQGSVVIDGDATAATWVRVAVNYATPFVVSSLGFLAARRASQTSEHPDRG